jgi:hypothetical protein
MMLVGLGLLGFIPFRTKRQGVESNPSAHTRTALWWGVPCHHSAIASGRSGHKGCTLGR